MNDNTIEISHVERRFGKTVALDDVSLDVPQGMVMGLIGENGAGKSTLLGLIAGLIFPSKGTVSVNGFRARSLSARRIIGYMPESPVFLGLYTARQVLLYHGALFRLSRKSAALRADELLDRLGLSASANRRCYGFSMGMRQRLALGVALMGDPRILLLDEPGNGLDPVGIADLRELLLDLSRSGKTMMISSHRLDELEKVTSDFVFLKQGQTVPFDATGSHSRHRLLRVGLLSPYKGRVEDILACCRTIKTGDHEILVEVSEIRDVPQVVSSLVENGAQVVSVNVEKQTAEQAFLSLCQKGR